MRRCQLLTLKMVALCGSGGAGRVGDVVLAAGVWLGAEGLLMEVLTDLGCKEISGFVDICCDIVQT